MHFVELLEWTGTFFLQSATAISCKGAEEALRGLLRMWNPSSYPTALGWLHPADGAVARLPATDYRLPTVLVCLHILAQNSQARSAVTSDFF